MGHSTGGGEVAHYVVQHANGRVAKAALIGAVPPLMVRTYLQGLSARHADHPRRRDQRGCAGFHPADARHVLTENLGATGTARLSAVFVAGAGGALKTGNPEPSP